jgi:hypothetical protein
MSRRPTIVVHHRPIGGAVSVTFLLLLAFSASASAHIRERNFWFVRQAESIHTIRTYEMSSPSCEGFGERKVIRVKSEGRIARYAKYRHFRCHGAAGVCGVGGVELSYVLHPLGWYDGRFSPHVATDVWIRIC